MTIKGTAVALAFTAAFITVMFAVATPIAHIEWAGKDVAMSTGRIK